MNNNNFEELINQLTFVYNEIDIDQQNYVESQLDNLLTHVQEYSFKAKKAKELLAGYHCMGNKQCGFYIAPPNINDIYIRHQTDSMSQLRMTINPELPCGSSELEAWAKAYDKGLFT